MKCKRCDSEMKITTAFRLSIDDILQATPSLECVKCGMLYAGGQWMDMRAEPIDEYDDDNNLPVEDTRS